MRACRLYLNRPGEEEGGEKSFANAAGPAGGDRQRGAKPVLLGDGQGNETTSKKRRKERGDTEDGEKIGESGTSQPVQKDIVGPRFLYM